MNNQSPSRESQAEIDAHVRAKEIEISIGSRLVAGATCAAMAAFLAFSSSFSGLGDHSVAWIAAIGLIVGGLLGERLVFTLLGALIATELLAPKCL